MSSQANLSSESGRKQETTNKKYEAGWRRWKDWARSFGMSTFAECKRILEKSRRPKKLTQPSIQQDYVDIHPDYAGNLDEIRTLFVVLVGSL